MANTACATVVSGSDLAAWITVDLGYEAPVETVVVQNGFSIFRADLEVRSVLGGGGRGGRLGRAAGRGRRGAPAGVRAQCLSAVVPLQPPAIHLHSLPAVRPVKPPHTSSPSNIQAGQHAGREWGRERGVLAGADA